MLLQSFQFSWILGQSISSLCYCALRQSFITNYWSLNLRWQSEWECYHFPQQESISGINDNPSFFGRFSGTWWTYKPNQVLPITGTKLIVYRAIKHCVIHWLWEALPICHLCKYIQTRLDVILQVGEHTFRSVAFKWLHCIAQVR